VAAALAHYEAAHRTATTPSTPGASRRSRWGTAGRQGAMRGGS
jgi:hypothetical protein